VKTLVTGATGLVGHFIARSLLARGHEVRCLVRSLDKAARVLPPGCVPIAGDVTAPETLAPAVEGCEWVFHAAGFPEQWLRDNATFDRVNAGGTEHMLAAARAAKVKRFIHTSTIDVFTWRPGETYDESELDPAPKKTHYERSKQRADQLVQAAVADGVDAIFLHPSGVYGPAHTDSAGVGDLLKKLEANKVPALLPGGMPVVYGPDVGEGHVRAAERAATGARYILSERYHSLTDFAREALAQLGIERKVPRVIPYWVASMISGAGTLKAKLTGHPPLMPRGQLQFLQVDSYPNAARAERELGLTFTPLARGLAETIAWQRTRLAA
jgi:dihydroflavonol-4-reductase